MRYVHIPFIIEYFIWHRYLITKLSSSEGRFLTHTLELKNNLAALDGAAVIELFYSK